MDHKITLNITICGPTIDRVKAELKKLWKEVKESEELPERTTSGWYITRGEWASHSMHSNVEIDNDP